MFDGDVEPGECRLMDDVVARRDDGVRPHFIDLATAKLRAHFKEKGQYL